MQSDLIRQGMHELLNAERCRHSIGAEKAALLIGGAYSLDPEKLSEAALLHDIGKSIKKSGMVRYADENHIFLSEDDIRAGGVIHARIGPHIAGARFGVTDPDVLDAIRCHTTGRAGMGPLQKAVFAADFLDPSRGLEETVPLLELAQKDLDRALFEILKRKFRHIIEEGDYIHPDAIGFYNELWAKISQGR